MKKSPLLLLGVAALGAGMLTGCGEAPDTGQVIILWTTFNDTYQTVINNAIRSFTSKYPEYTVKNIKQEGSYDDLKEMAVKGAAAGTYPDLIAAYPDSVADFLSAGIALDITEYMEDPEIGWTTQDINDVPEGYVKEGQGYVIEGTYSLPLCKSTEAMFYNRNVLIGLDLSMQDPDINDGQLLDDTYFQNLTWDELFNHLCPALVEYNETLPDTDKIFKPDTKYEKDWAIVGWDSDDNLFITLAEQYGLPFTSINQTSGIGSVDFVEKDSSGKFKDVLPGYMDLMKTFGKAHAKGYFTTSGTIGTRANYVFTTGGMLFSIGSTGGTKYQISESDDAFKDVGIAPVPQRTTQEEDPDYEPKAINQGPSIAFLERGATDEIKQSHAKGAWLLYKEWSSTEYATQWAMNTGYAPIRKSVSSSEAFRRWSDPNRQPAKTLAHLNALTAQFVASSASMDSLFSSPVFSGSSKARKGVSGIIADIFKTDAAYKDGDIVEDKFEEAVTTNFRKGYNNSI